MNSAKQQDTKLTFRDCWHFYTPIKELSEREMKKTIPFTIIIRKKRNKLTEKVKDLY